MHIAWKWELAETDATKTKKLKDDRMANDLQGCASFKRAATQLEADTHEYRESAQIRKSRCDMVSARESKTQSCNLIHEFDQGKQCPVKDFFPRRLE